MPVSFQEIRGFAGAMGVGVLCLIAGFLIASVFATNLPLVMKDLLGNAAWGPFATLPFLVVAYVIGLLAIATVSVAVGFEPGVAPQLDTASTARYLQLAQEAEILSGSVIAFVLLALAAFLQIHPWPGWMKTLLFTGCLCLAIALGCFRLAQFKDAHARHLAAASPPESSTAR